MAIMLAKTYHALKAAGAPEEDAIAAAEELADYQNRFSAIDHELAVVGGGIEALDARVSGVENRLGVVENRLGVVENRLGAVETSVATLAGKITVLTWAVGINAAATMAILGMLVRGHG
jgi:phage shock protein A